MLQIPVIFYTVLTVRYTGDVSVRTGIVPLLKISYEHLLIKILQAVALKFNLHNGYEKF